MIDIDELERLYKAALAAIDTDRVDDAFTKEDKAFYLALWDAFPALRARVAELEAAARPIPVTKRLPEINVSILARVKGRKAFMQAQLTPRNTWRVWGGEYAFDSVTHWLPMPEV